MRRILLFILLVMYCLNAALASSREAPTKKNITLHKAEWKQQAESEGDLHHVIWQNLTNVEVEGTRVTKLGDKGWNAGMFSINKLPQSSDGLIEHKVIQQNVYMFGLSPQDIDAHYKSINYAWYVRKGLAYVFIGGKSHQRFESKPGDVLQIEKIEGSIILFKKNGIPVYEASLEEPMDLYVDVSMHKVTTTELEVKATFEAKFNSSKWRNVDNVDIGTSTITKTGSTGWNAGFFSEGKIVKGQDGFIEHTVENQSKYYMVGVSQEDKDAHYKSIEFAWYVRPGYAYIYSNGKYQAQYRSGVGDILRIERIGNTLHMLKNNIIMRTYSVDADAEYHIDASLYHAGTYDLQVLASFPNPSASYAILKKKLDGGYAVFDGDIKFKFIQEYAVAGSQLPYKIYNWTRTAVKYGYLDLDYGVNWFSISSSGLTDGDTYVLEVVGNKDQTYLLKFKYQENDGIWAEELQSEPSDN